MFKTIQSEIDKGLKGDIVFMPIVDKKLGKVVAVPKATSILLGGVPGSGKTAIADTTFVLEPFDYLKDNNLDINMRWIYRSMERPTKYKLGKWLCYKLFKDHGILIDVPTLYGWPNKKYKLTPELLDCIKTYDEYFEELQEYVTIIDGVTGPTGVFMDAKAFMDARGKTERVDKYNSVYIPNDPKEIVVQLVDHVGKIKSEVIQGNRLNDKEILDAHSKNTKNQLRDFYEMVTVDISQLNRNIEDNYRQIKTDLDIKPSDFKGTSVLYEDSDIVFGLLNPYKYNEMKFGDYNINKFVTDKNYCRYRAMKVLKNSYGPDDLMFDYNFIGECGVMRMLPRSDDMSELDYKHSALAYHPKALASIKEFNLDKTEYPEYYEVFGLE